MAWRRPGDKLLSEPMMVNLLTHICVTRPQWVKETCVIYFKFHLSLFLEARLTINLYCFVCEVRMKWLSSTLALCERNRSIITIPPPPPPPPPPPRGDLVFSRVPGDLKHHGLTVLCLPFPPQITSFSDAEPSPRSHLSPSERPACQRSMGTEKDKNSHLGMADPAAA